MRLDGFGTARGIHPRTGGLRIAFAGLLLALIVTAWGCGGHPQGPPTDIPTFTSQDVNIELRGMSGSVGRSGGTAPRVGVRESPPPGLEQTDMARWRDSHPEDSTRGDPEPLLP